MTRTGIAAKLTAASGGNREAELGQWSAGCECRPRHEADAGNHNPGQDGGAQHRNQSPSGALISPRVSTAGYCVVGMLPPGRGLIGPVGNRSGADRRQRAKTSPGRGKMSHSDKKGSKGKRSWGRGQRDANAAPRREAYAGNHNPRQGGGAQQGKQSAQWALF